MARNNKAGRLSSLEKSYTIIERIQELDGARVNELASDLDIAPSTIHAHVATLNDLGFLAQEGDEYHIGLRFLGLGGYACHRRHEYEFTKEKVKQIARETEERAQYIAEEHGKGIYLFTTTGSKAVHVDARIGKRVNLHASAAGKAILAHLPENRLGMILDQQPLIGLTNNTITERAALLDELEDVRNRGYSYNNEESIDGLRAIGVPVLDQDDDVLGALSVSGPTNRMTGDRYQEKLPELLLGVANELELNIAFS